jgi:dTDP-4-dehydrorhamnose 3,5-epimerase
MKVIQTPLPGVLLIEPAVFGDARGFFLESWNQRRFADATGVDLPFVQDNHSRSARHVLRGIHYQLVKPQGKLVRVASGEVFDVAIDLRRSSPTFGRWYGCRLDAIAHRQLWIPPGFGHGFVVLSETADFLYKTTEYWYPEHERSVAWNDPAVGIGWMLGGAAPILAAKDAAAPRLADATVYD